MKTSIRPNITSGAVPLLSAAAGLSLAALMQARAATMILHNFTGGPSDGGQPYGSLTLSGSKFYGVTSAGGGNGSGVLFSMNTDGTGFSLLHSFTGGVSDGSSPVGTLAISGSKLYGMTFGGTIFSMNTDGTGFGLLHSFTGGVSDGSAPNGSLTISGSKLYGMTRDGGSNTFGTIFSLNTDGSGYGLLHSFDRVATNGADPFGALTLSGSKLYGMTHYGGSSAGGGNSGSGALFSMNTDGTGFSLLHSFTPAGIDGDLPVGSLTLSGSKLYGTTYVGGSGGAGTIFSINTDGTGLNLLHAFTGGVSDGSNPSGSLALFGSTLYGMTENGGGSNAGTLFSIGTNGSGYQLLESFGGAPANGADPFFNDPTLSSNGSTLYGMTFGGGTANKGVVFSRAVPEPGTFALLAFGTLLLTPRRRRSAQHFSPSFPSSARGITSL